MATTTSPKDYWVKQSDEPAFPELLWSRPEHRNQAGKLLIIGGNSWGFAAPAQAYQHAVTAGVGSARVLLPEAVHKLVGKTLEHAEAAASTPSGSFSKRGLQEWLAQAHWADGVLIAGDLGRNSETAIVLEQFLAKYPGQVVLTKDAVDYLISAPNASRQRPHTGIVLSMAQLQKLAQAYGFTKAFTFNLGLLQLVELLHEFTLTFPNLIVVRHLETTFVATEGRVSTTKLRAAEKVWRVATAAQAAVWWLQNPKRPLEAFSTALVV